MTTYRASRPPLIRIAGALLALGFLLLHPSATRGVDKFWQPPEGDWNVATNWNPAGVPTGDTVFITDGRTVNITATPPPIFRLYPGGTLDFGGATNGAGTVNHSAGDLQVVGSQSWVVVGDKVGPTSTYNLSGGSLFVQDDFMTVGQNGTAVLNVSGTGSLNTRGLNFGRWDRPDPAHGTGTLSGGGSIMTRGGGFNVGLEGIGVFTQDGGTLTVDGSGYDGWAFIGGHDNGAGARTGTYNMNGGTFNSRERIQIAQGAGSTGTFNHVAGDVTAGRRNTDGSPGPEGFIEIGQGGVGTYNLSGGTLTAVRSVIVGAWNGGDGRLNISNNATLNAGEALQVARGSNNARDRVHAKAGLVNQTGGTVNAGWAEIGTNRSTVSPPTDGVGTYKISGGNLTTQFELVIGRNGGIGVFEVTGGTVSVGAQGTGQRTFIIGRGGRGTFNMSAGAINVPEAFMLSDEEGARPGIGQGTQTGGTITSAGTVDIGMTHPATYTLSGGSLIAGTNFNLGVMGLGQGVLNLSGEGIAQGNGVFVGREAGTSGEVNQTGGTMRVGSGNLVIAEQTGSTGTYTLAGGLLDGGIANTMRYGGGTGEFAMKGGAVKNFATIRFSLANEGGRLILGEQEVGSVLQNNTTIEGDYTQGPAAALELNIANPGQAEQLNVSGNVSLNGNLTIQKDPTWEPLIGTRMEIITAAAVSGRFTTVTNNEATPQFRFVPRYNPTTVELVVAVAGDTNLDNSVTFADFQQLERNFGRPGTWSEGDFNGDGSVGFEDFQFLFENFGDSFPGPGPAAISASDQAALQAFHAAHVPEPGACAIGLGITLLLSRRRRPGAGIG